MFGSMDDNVSLCLGAWIPIDNGISSLVHNPFGAKILQPNLQSDFSGTLYRCQGSPTQIILQDWSSLTE